MVQQQKIDVIRPDYAIFQKIHLHEGPTLPSSQICYFRQVAHKKNLIVQIERATYDAPKKKNGSHSNHIDQFYKLFCRAHIFAYTLRTRHLRIIEFQMFE